MVTPGRGAGRGPPARTHGAGLASCRALRGCSARGPALTGSGPAEPPPWAVWPAGSPRPQLPPVETRRWTRPRLLLGAGPGLQSCFRGRGGRPAWSFGVRVGCGWGGQASSLGPRGGSSAGAAEKPGWGCEDAPLDRGVLTLRSCGPGAPWAGAPFLPAPPLPWGPYHTQLVAPAPPQPGSSPQAAGRAGPAAGRGFGWRPGPWGGPRRRGGAAPAGTRATEASGGGGRKGGQAAGKGDDSSGGARIGNAATWEQPRPG